MPLKCGIVGLPNVGKSTFFGAIVKRDGLAENFPFATINPNIGVVTVPDKRLATLQQCVHSERVVPTTVSFVDIAGLVKGASKGEGLGNQFLANIREVDALVHVVRCFADDNIIHVAGGVDPVFDQEVINEELRLADIASMKKRLEKIRKLAKSGNQEMVRQEKLATFLLEGLDTGKDVRTMAINTEDSAWLKSWQLLTAKPMMYVANIDESAIASGSNTYVEALKSVVADQNTCVLPLCLGLEAQIVLLPEEEQQGYLEAYGLSDTSLNQVIQEVYHLLGLMTYFTAGPKEVHAWTVRRGALAPEAAGVIHSDFEKNFIKAEVIKFSDFIHHGSEEKCKQAGRVAVEGRDYVVEDGDVIHFKCR